MLHHCPTCDQKRNEKEFRPVYSRHRHWECIMCETIRKENRSYVARGLDPVAMRKKCCDECGAKGYLLKDDIRFLCRRCRQELAEERVEARKIKSRERQRPRYDGTPPILPKACEVCGIKERLCIDHVTKMFRGILCVRCNAGIRFFESDAGLMKKAIEYLKKYKTPAK